MSDLVTIQKNDLKQIANTIRKKLGTTDEMVYPNGLLHSLDCIPNYVGRVTRFTKDQLLENSNFYDYDGSLLFSFTPEETRNLYTLPPLPATHPRLVPLDWNWTIDQVKEGSHAADVGLLYTTASSFNEFDILLTAVTGKTVTFSSDLVVDDWGDGTTSDNGGYTHTYENYGEYTVLSSNSIIPAAVIGNTQANPDLKLQRVFVSSYTSRIDAHAFDYCRSLSLIHMCASTKGLSPIASDELYSLTSYFFPRQKPNTSCYFKNASSLSMCSLPYNLKQYKSYSFENCTALSRLVFGNITSIEANAFNGASACKIFDFTRCMNVPTLQDINAFANIDVDYKILVLPSMYNLWMSNPTWSLLGDHIRTA